MNRETEPIPPDDVDNVPASDYLLAYREYWNGRKWVAGEYKELIRSPEVDDFGGINGKQEVDRRSPLVSPLPRQQDPQAGIPDPPVG